MTERLIFIGIDLGWYGKPSGLAALPLEGAALRVAATARLEDRGEILEWVRAQVGAADSVAGVDAPLVIRCQAGIRGAERDLNRDFRRYHAGCHAANLGLPFAGRVLAFSRALEDLGFRHGAALKPMQRGRHQIEVHPHAAAVNLFDLPRIVKYKRGLRAERARELARLRRLMTEHLARTEPFLNGARLPSIPRAGDLKPAEDRIDAVLCAYIAAHWWYWGRERNRVYGTQHDGYVVVPERYSRGECR